jgi:hypothetical protein
VRSALRLADLRQHLAQVVAQAMVIRLQLSGCTALLPLTQRRRRGVAKQ